MNLPTSNYALWLGVSLTTVVRMCEWLYFLCAWLGANTCCVMSYDLSGAPQWVRVCKPETEQCSVPSEYFALCRGLVASGCFSLCVSVTLDMPAHSWRVSLRKITIFTSQHEMRTARICSPTLHTLSRWSSMWRHWTCYVSPKGLGSPLLPMFLWVSSLSPPPPAGYSTVWCGG